MTTLRQAAIAVIARWDLPHRHHQLSTTRIFEDLRKALEEPEQEPVATVQSMNGITFGYLDVIQPVGTKLYAAPVEAPDIKALTKERDALLAAAKLAVEALDDWYYGANQDRPKAAVYVALQALKSAGVS